MQQHIDVFTDGCYKKSTKIGAYGIVIINPADGVFTLMGDFMPDTTSNRMELSGPQYALKHLTSNNPQDRQIVIRSDSEYFVKGFNDWMENWKKKGWKIKPGRPPLNLEYWVALYGYKGIIKPTPQAKWIKGHSNSLYNRIADQIAEKCAATLEPLEIKFNSELELLNEYSKHIGAVRR